MAKLWVGTRKGLFRFEPIGPEWKVTQTAFLGDPVTAVLVDPRDGALYAALKHGHFGSKLHRSSDGGETWMELGAPAWPERPADADDKDMLGRPWPWSLDMIWSLEAGGPDVPGELWCGTIPGGLFRSTDRGASWALVRSLWDHPDRKRWSGGGYDLPGIHSVLVHPQRPDEVLLGVSTGGVWWSGDRGESWACTSTGMYAAYMPPPGDDPVIQDPHRLARARSSPDVVWAQHHNGVFKSNDAGRSWHEIKTVEPSGFGFAVAVHPRKPETVWLVPAIKDETRIPVDGKLVVSRTRDGGGTFEVLRRGLPQEHAYDLVYRHALDVDATGERLAFGSTTGNLWVSQDEGDTFTQLSAHLPPINCVRFAPHDL